MSKIKIVCGKRTEAFTEHHSKIREGLSVTCPDCTEPIDFDSNSKDLNAKRALIAARHFRLNADPGY
jgi:hypothetical protein